MKKLKLTYQIKNKTPVFYLLFCQKWIRIWCLKFFLVQRWYIIQLSNSVVYCDIWRGVASLICRRFVLVISLVSWSLESSSSEPLVGTWVWMLSFLVPRWRKTHFFVVFSERMVGFNCIDGPKWNVIGRVVILMWSCQCQRWQWIVKPSNIVSLNCFKVVDQLWHYCPWKKCKGNNEYEYISLSEIALE